MQNFINELKPKFKGRNFEPCLSKSNEANLYVEDNKVEEKSIFHLLPDDDTQKKCFHIQNPNRQEVILWAVDGCFAGKSRPLSPTFFQKCDAIVGSNQLVCLIEFKMEANPFSNPLTIQKNREEATQQLVQTISFLCQTLEVSYLTEKVDTIEAYICTPYQPKFTSQNAIAISFFDQYKIPLYEQNTKDLGFEKQLFFNQTASHS